MLYSQRSMDPVIQQILDRYRRIWALGHAQLLMGWDLETYMPEEGVKARSEASAELSLLRQELILSLKDLVEKADKREGLDDLEKGIVRVLKRSIKFYSAIPPDLLRELDRITSEAPVVWREAKRSSDYPKFRPYLAKIVDLERQVAEKLGYEGHPYNALLDLYEEGFTVREADSIFSTLIPGLKSTFDKVAERGYFPSSHPLEEFQYEVESMAKVNQEVLKLLDMPKGRFRMDVSAHPFTEGISVDDVRITTRYEGKDFRATLFSVIHESGHAIYELQIDRSLEMTPVGGGVSMGIHESQSRFWENVIGRSREFVFLIYPTLKEHLTFLEGYGEEDVYKYFNIVKPSPIRVDADEVTYNFHIALRYEIEKGLIGGSTDVSDLPSMWNDYMDKYLHYRPRNDGEGVLQDIHWSQGSFGYFPTYTLGNVVAALIRSHLPNLRDLVRERRFTEIKEFLREKIHKYGSIYPPKELLRRSFGEVYNPAHLLSYLSDKYLR